MQTKPSIVFVHGIGADGSCFSKVIPALQAEGYEVMASQHGLETSQSQQNQFPVTDVFSHIKIADGRVWILPQGVATFAGDLPEQEQKVVWATHVAPAADQFNRKVAGTMGATIYEVDSSHVPMLSNPRSGTNPGRSWRTGTS